MKKELKKEFLGVVDKEWGNHSSYYKYIFALQIDTFFEDDAGYIKHWKVGCYKKGVYEENEGDSAEDFILFLQDLIGSLGLETRPSKKDGKVRSKDLVVFYIDDILKIQGFFNNYITMTFKHYIQLLEFFEFRSYESWNKELKTIQEVALFMQEVVDKIFIPEKYYYLTPNQKTRKNLAKRCNWVKDDTAKNIFPDTMVAYANLRSALFGGICYCPHPGKTHEEKMICLDIKSAYIYTLLTMPHCIKTVNTEEYNPCDYEKYLDSDEYAFYGLFSITYSTFSNILHCFKTVEGKNLESGLNKEVVIMLTDVDLRLIMSLPKVEIKNIKCHGITLYQTGYLPAYVRDTLVEEFIKKNHIDSKAEPALYRSQKVIVNGIYGNTIKKIASEHFKSCRDNASLAPQWGIWTTSYTKDLLLGLALRVEDWVYSDTDSIYCKDTIRNRQIVRAYNKLIRDNMKNFCDSFGYDFEELQDLGTFEIEAEITKFRALKQKEYLYTKSDGKLVVKASGCNKEEMTQYDENYLYNCSKLPVGTRVFKSINPNRTTCIKDGKTYISEGSYYEFELGGETASLMLAYIAEMKEMKGDY